MFKVTSANAFLVVARMGFTLVAQKVLAIIIGAEGIAIVGNLKNVIAFFERFSVLGTSNGLVKYIAEYKEDKEKLNQLFSTTFLFSLVSALLSFVILFFGADNLNQLLFGNARDFKIAFKILAFVIPFFSLNAIIHALLNGLSAYKTFTKSTLLIVAINAILIVGLTYKYGLYGSLLAVVTIPFVQFICYLILTYKTSFKYINLRTVTLSSSFKSKLLPYSLMSILVVLFININDIAIRRLIESKIGISDSGYWTAMNSISKTYMQFTAAIFPLYILPKFSRISNTLDFRREVKQIYKMLLPPLIIGLFLVFLLKDYIIRLLYTPEFLEMSKYFKWQLLGDLVKFIAIVIAYQFLAKKQTKNFILTELFSVVIFYILSVYFIDYYGTEGVIMAHFVRYILYFVVVLFILRNTFIGGNKAL
ncbi:O-antigen translocase [Hyunsoonleella flava]|uniref:O-antigen translocase n=1 Tax=Hyunsoonleella flava TaxID=2527939 RepID=A0A4Q9FJ46_9FLAO|nr:O-antigen translocase [Hyunsoonleella flava]TBN05622.1 O-antigen translocase [Hyunsoonleella flava]